MIKIESVKIRDLRGIRDLTLECNSESFAIYGLNGSGKSGVVDAIEFGLTGNISRLMGKGTGGLSVQRHGPHILQKETRNNCKVTLQIKLLELDRTAQIIRSVEDPDNPQIEPNDDKVRAILDKVAKQPEIVLSRREVIKYILAEPTERSNEIQALLRLENIGKIRKALKSTQTNAKKDRNFKTQVANDAAESLRTHLGIDQLDEAAILEVCNAQRSVLGLSQLNHLGATLRLDEGVESEQQENKFNKVSALNDIKKLVERLMAPDPVSSSAQEIISACKEAESDPNILVGLKQLPFLHQGEELIESADCPFCDITWESQSELAAHLREKILKLQQVEGIQNRVQEAATSIESEVTSIAGIVTNVVDLASKQPAGELVTILNAWSQDLAAFAKEIRSVEGALPNESRLSSGWMAIPEGLHLMLDQLNSEIESMPDLSAKVNAQTFLAIAQDRYAKRLNAMQEASKAERALLVADTIYDVYCDEAKLSLQQLYDQVKTDFSLLYGQLNSEDESQFTAQFAPEEGKLDLLVDFYGQGYYPPIAYHSEGHQDALGVCLYLALMKHLHGDGFSLAVFDDVVMSVDSGHRRQFCKLLKEHFPHTQFIITTHDRVWASQMKHHGLVTAKSCATFHSWRIDSGPICQDEIDVWDKISEQTAAGHVAEAAFMLRNHLEFVMSDLADGLRAQVPYRADSDYDLGDLYSAVVGQFGKLIGKARDAATSWNNAEAVSKLSELRKRRSTALAMYEDDNWIVNKTIHYNEWANVDAAEMSELVASASEVLSLFRCLECNGWIYLSGPKQADAIRCDCSSVFYNLVLRSS